MDETRPWPRAQRMPPVVAGERARPHHYQAVAEYDEARGNTRGGMPTTATQVNEAITWWNKRADGEQPITAEVVSLAPAELADLRAAVEHLSGPDAWDQDRLEPALILVLTYVRRVLAALGQSPLTDEQPKPQRPSGE